jgi:hypothetical protein
MENILVIAFMVIQVKSVKFTVAKVPLATTAGFVPVELVHVHVMMAGLVLNVQEKCVRLDPKLMVKRN